MIYFMLQAGGPSFKSFKEMRSDEYEVQQDAIIPLGRDGESYIPRIMVWIWRGRLIVQVEIASGGGF